MFRSSGLPEYGNRLYKKFVYVIRENCRGFALHNLIQHELKVGLRLLHLTHRAVLPFPLPKASNYSKGLMVNSTCMHHFKKLAISIVHVNTLFISNKAVVCASRPVLSDISHVACKLYDCKCSRYSSMSVQVTKLIKSTAANV